MKKRPDINYSFFCFENFCNRSSEQPTNTSAPQLPTKNSDFNHKGKRLYKILDSKSKNKNK